MNLRILKISAAFCLLAPIFSDAQSTSDGSSPSTRVLGYTEPYRSIEMTSSESGVIGEIHVEEGDTVEANTPLISLDNKVHEAELRIAETQAASTAQIAVTEAELEIAKKRFTAFSELRARNTASADEVERAGANLKTAQNKHTLALEAQTIAKLQVDQIKAQIERRILRSPINGEILEINRDVAESATSQTAGSESPVLVRVAQMDRLRLVIHVPAESVRDLKKGAELPVRILLNNSLDQSREDSGADTMGTVEFISPAIDPSSETVKTRLVIENADRKIRSGVHAMVFLP